MAKDHSLPLFYGYVIVAASFFIQAVSWGVNNSFGVFFNPLLSEFGWLRATVSGAASLSFLLYGCGSILMGNLNDRFGPRAIMTGCGLLLGLGYLLMTWVQTVWHLYLFYGMIVGLGLSGMDVVLLSTVARWFVKKRGTMTGIVKVGTGVGMLLMPILISWLIRTWGWRDAYLFLGITVLLSVIALARFLVRDPERKGQFPDHERQAVRTGADNGEDGLTFREAVHTREFWTVCVVYFLILVSVYTVMMHIVQHAIDLEIPPADAATILSVIGGVSIAGRFVMGGAGDRIGNRSALFVCLLFLLAALGCLQLAERLSMFYVFAALYGFAHGGFFSLSSPLLAGLFGTRSHGLILGIVIFCSTIGGAIGPIAAGHAFDVTGSYRVVFLALAVLTIIGLLLTASMKAVRRETFPSSPGRTR